MSEALMRPVPSLPQVRPGARQGPPRVAISGTILGLGGIRTHLLLLCQLLRRRGIDVSLFATGAHWDGNTLEKVRDMGVTLHLPPAAVWSSRAASAAFARVAWPWLVPRSLTSLYCIGAGRSHLLLHRLRPEGAVSINHEIVEPPGPESMAGICAATLDASVANSRGVASSMRRFWPGKPIRTIPFLTSDRTTPPPPRRAAVGGRELRVVYLGRLVDQKRPDVLVKRWPELSRRAGLAPARLDVYGYDPDGSMLPRLRTLAGEAGAAGRVAIHGAYELADLPRILGASDLVVLPSLWEGLPLVLVEAMLHGVPFAATAAGGTEELGDGNPDVVVTGTAWEEFEDGLAALAARLRARQVDPVRLHAWAERRYGYASVSRQWLDCLCDPSQFFAS